MRVTDEFTITKRTSDSAFYGERKTIPYVCNTSDPNYNEFEQFYTLMRNTTYTSRPALCTTLATRNQFPNVLKGFVEVGEVSDATPTATEAPTLSKKDSLVIGIQRLMNFFSEFSFVPSFRFTNTFAYACADSRKTASEYVRNYFALMDSSYRNEVEEKMKSAEFSEIVKLIGEYGAPASPINSRFAIYYGSAGTGKTTIAQTLSDNRCIVCNSSMLPSDLMEDFIFKDGNPDFNPSLLWNCMEEGKTIVLDEINLLPFDSLRFLQGIVDGKVEFYYKNRPVHIHEGFKIIGTMNLSLGGMTYGLPEPLVDRCCEIREFVLTADQLAKAIIGQEEEEE